MGYVTMMIQVSVDRLERKDTEDWMQVEALRHQHPTSSVEESASTDLWPLDTETSSCARRSWLTESVECLTEPRVTRIKMNKKVENTED